MTGQDFGEALHAWRNVPQADGYSPAMLLFGKRQHTKLPTLPFQHMLIDRQEAHSTKAHALKSTLAEFDKRAVKRPILLPGDKVIIQDPTSKLWSLTGSILQSAADGQSYTISTDSGHEIRRGIKLLRKLDSPQPLARSPPPPAADSSPPPADSPAPAAGPSRQLPAAPAYLLKQDPASSPQSAPPSRPVRKKFANVRFRDYV